MLPNITLGFVLGYRIYDGSEDFLANNTRIILSTTVGILSLVSNTTVLMSYNLIKYNWINTVISLISSLGWTTTVYAMISDKSELFSIPFSTLSLLQLFSFFHSATINLTEKDDPVKPTQLLKYRQVLAVLFILALCILYIDPDIFDIVPSDNHHNTTNTTYRTNTTNTTEELAFIPPLQTFFFNHTNISNSTGSNSTNQTIICLAKEITQVIAPLINIENLPLKVFNSVILFITLTALFFGFFISEKIAEIVNVTSGRDFYPEL